MSACASAYGLLTGANDHRTLLTQFLVAVRLPEGAAPPDTLAAKVGPISVAFLRSATFEAELQLFEPAPAGERWWGWLSSVFPYSIDVGQSTTVTMDVSLPPGPDGGPYPSPVRRRPTWGLRAVDASTDHLETRPVDCGTLPAHLYRKIDSDNNICIDSPNQASTRGFLDAALIDFGIVGGTVQATAGSAATATFSAKRSGAADPSTSLALTASGGPPGGTVTLDRSAVSLGGDPGTPVVATVVVPAGTPGGSYQVTLTATAPGKPTRTGTVTVVVPASPPSADTSSVAAARSALGVNLSGAASLAVQVDRFAPGRRAGRACSLTAITGTRCTRTVRLGTVRRAAPGGASRGTIGPRVGGRPLGPGRYRLTIRATDAAGNRSAVRTLVLTIVRR